MCCDSFGRNGAGDHRGVKWDIQDGNVLISSTPIMYGEQGEWKMLWPDPLSSPPSLTRAKTT